MTEEVWENAAQIKKRNLEIIRVYIILSRLNLI
jgi:hypothetical protein